MLQYGVILILSESEKENILYDFIYINFEHRQNYPMKLKQWLYLDIRNNWKETEGVFGMLIMFYFLTVMLVS